MKPRECSEPNCEAEGCERFDHYGIFAGFLCDKHWENSPIRKDEYFDESYAGESLDDEY